MFTDEILEKIYAEKKSGWELELLKTVVKSMDLQADVNNALKRANNIWRLFASRHQDINPNGFKLSVQQVIPEIADEVEQMLK